VPLDETSLALRAPSPAQAAAELQGVRQALGLGDQEGPLDVAVWFHTGLLCRALDALDDAVTCFKKVIELAPEDPWAYWELAGVYVARGEPRAAVVVLGELGRRLGERGRWGEATRAWEQAAQLSPEDADVLENLRQASSRTSPPWRPFRASPNGSGNGLFSPPGTSTVQEPPPALLAPKTSPGPAGTEEAPPGPSPAGEAPHPRPSPETPRRRRGRAAGGLLEEVLLTEGWVGPDQLKQALQVQQRNRTPLGQILVEMGVLTEEQLARALAAQWGLPFTSLAEETVDTEAAQLIPAHLARRHGVVAVGRRQTRLVVAMSDPANVLAIDDIRLVTGLDVDIVVASPSDITKIQSVVYAGSLNLEELLKESAGEAETVEEARPDEIALEHLRTMVEDAPIVRAVNQILTQAVLAEASDIHIEPHRREVKVRFRIDGVLQDVMTPPKAVQAPLISRVKILANMDIAERRLPQDGHIHLRLSGRELDLRVSTLPTVLGEKVVIRILDQARTRLTLPQLGFAGDLLATWENLITKPYGLILVTGPTGSGKTTTLYTSLARINTPERNIVSIEDPVEYQIPRVNQVQVNPKIGLTFANGLRTILRQDPDVVLIGEIRDRETAEIAVQASMTGHLVLSTVHTNDAPGAVTRLVDMGIEPFLITSSLVGVLAQRLVRVICDRCKEAYVPPADALRRLGVDPQDAPDLRLYRGRGCEVCRKTGYRGRIGVFELMVMTDELRQLVLGGGSSDALREAAQRTGMRTLRQNGVLKVLEGVTTFEEVLRVIFVSES
jgi:type IV pilus assembly protein PilB